MGKFRIRQTILHFSDTVAVDEIIKILTELHVDHFRQIVWRNRECIGEILKREIAATIELVGLHCVGQPSLIAFCGRLIHSRPGVRALSRRCT